MGAPVLYIVYRTVYCRRNLEQFIGNHLQMFSKIGVLKNLTMFTGKHLCWSLFFNKVADHNHATLLKNRLQHRCFFCDYCDLFKNSFCIEHLKWLFLAVGGRRGADLHHSSYESAPLEKNSHHAHT